jgi:lipopolysaccharide transport protein LptA
MGSLCFAADLAATPALRVAIAPFAGEAGALAISKQLAEQISRRDVERLIAPGEFVADNTFEPRAADVRRWAYNSAVDAVVVGRVYTVGNAKRRTRIVETVVRSGHSGAELSRHEVASARGASIHESLDTLAASILSGLGYVEVPSEAGTEENTEGGNVDLSKSSQPGQSGHSLDAERSKHGFRSDAPIEIKAEEAEIINLDGGRRLIFQRNVHVQQANISLRSDRLEALYRKGESEPRELRAEGRVAIDQGHRRAKCDRAIYRREDNRLTCSGHAELIQGCDIVRGESIEFDLAGDQARVTGAASIVIYPESEANAGCSTDRGQP